MSGTEMFVKISHQLALWWTLIVTMQIGKSCWNISCLSVRVLKLIEQIDLNVTRVFLGITLRNQINTVIMRQAWIKSLPISTNKEVN